MGSDYSYDKLYDLFQAATGNIDVTGTTIKDDTGKVWEIFDQHIVKVYLDVVDEDGSIATVVLTVENDGVD